MEVQQLSMEIENLVQATTIYEKKENERNKRKERLYKLNHKFSTSQTTHHYGPSTSEGRRRGSTRKPAFQTSHMYVR